MQPIATQGRSCKGSHRPGESIEARAIDNELAKAVDYAGFVELSLHYDKVNSWL